MARTTPPRFTAEEMQRIAALYLPTAYLRAIQSARWVLLDRVEVEALTEQLVYNNAPDIVVKVRQDQRELTFQALATSGNGQCLYAFVKAVEEFLNQGRSKKKVTSLSLLQDLNGEITQLGEAPQRLIRPVFFEKLETAHITPACKKQLSSIFEDSFSPSQKDLIVNFVNAYVEAYDKMSGESKTAQTRTYLSHDVQVFAILDKVMWIWSEGMRTSIHNQRRTQGLILPIGITTTGHVIWSSLCNQMNNDAEPRPLLQVDHNHLDADHFIVVDGVAWGNTKPSFVGRMHWPFFIERLDLVAKLDPLSLYGILSVSDPEQGMSPQMTQARLVLGLTRLYLTDTIKTALNLDPVEQEMEELDADEAEYYRQNGRGNQSAERDKIHNLAVAYARLFSGAIEHPPLAGTLREVLLRAYAQQIELFDNPMHPIYSEEAVSRIYKSLSGFVSNPSSILRPSGSFQYSQLDTIIDEIVIMLLRGVDLKISGMNLLARTFHQALLDPETAEFDEPAADLLARMERPDATVSLKAKALLLASAKMYGYTRLPNGWHAKGTLPDGSEHSVRIDKNGAIFLDNSHRCIVFGATNHRTTIDLPFGDEIAIRMWTLANPAAYAGINTLSPADRRILAQLFGERKVKDRTLAVLADEIYDEMDKRRKAKSKK